MSEKDLQLSLFWAYTGPVRVCWFLILVLFHSAAFAKGVQFSFVYPQGEGDAESARPYLENLFDYLQTTTGTLFEGRYFNQDDEAEGAFKAHEVDLAIVSHDFYAAHQKRFELTPLLKTVPVYSEGAYEQFYIMANHDFDATTLIEDTPAQLYASQSQPKDFLREGLFKGDEGLQKVPWALVKTSDILQAIVTVAASQTREFVLLNGYEFSVVKKLKDQNKEFAKLKLIYTSPELPSPVLVTVNARLDEKRLVQIRDALLKMPDSLNGALILKKLRLKGFAGM